MTHYLYKGADRLENLRTVSLEIAVEKAIGWLLSPAAGVHRTGEQDPDIRVVQNGYWIGLDDGREFSVRDH